MEIAGIIKLKTNEEIRIEKGHLWIFRSEIQELSDDIRTGNFVEVHSHKSDLIGFGFYNNESQLAVRIISREPIESFHELLEQRIVHANEFRKKIISHNSYRVIHGESDFLPGLIIDKYNDHFVIESLTAWVDEHIEEINKILVENFSPQSVIERSESVWRERDGLPKRKRIIFGESTTTVEFYGVKFRVDLLEGQKTGFFLDQVENRFALQKYVGNKNVLDCFCNDGGFGINAAVAGAASVVGIDSSERAIQNAIHNSKLNGVENICNWEQNNVFEKLRELAEEGKKFDCVVLDPPSFVKSRNKIKSALKGYEKLNALALQILTHDGILLTCSCSHHITPGMFSEMLFRSGSSVNRKILIVEMRGVGPDHPVYLPMPETRYLTCFICRVV